MKRREFLETAALAGAALTLGNMKKVSAADNDLTQTSDDFELSEMTVMQLQEAMKSGRWSSERITEKYLDRIRAVDKRLNSVIEINRDAERIAVEMDKERKNGRVRSMLHGIPVLLKDNIDTADKMKTTAGSLALLDAPTPRADAFLVRQLREAGAVIIGKTNLSEWANFRSTKSSSGWSARGGQTRNPYILDRNACGSSSGSGAAIAANLAAVAVGTETDGSIICPAATCGIAGIKPTLGLVSRSGVIPIAHSQDTAGPMTRTVADAAILLTAMVGFDPKDSITSQAKSKAVKDYAQFLQKDGLRGTRIGVGRQFFGRSSKIDAVIEPHLQVLKDGGATLTDVEFPHLTKFGDAEFTVLLYEFKADLNAYLAQRNAPYKTLADLIKFNEDNREREMPYFGQEIFLMAEKKGDLNTREYRLALQKSKTLTQAQGLDMVMTKNNLDAVVAPSGGAAWMIDLVNGDCGVFESGSMAAVAGYPIVTVPAGYVQGLPAGISFFGRAFTEPTLIKIAYAFEQATKARVTPKFLQTYQ
ncbi:MAG TPA: amidase [Pyrinomonadaceae bacterium]|nr:amidase [Pyrinomonadaceae bacterium]